MMPAFRFGNFKGYNLLAIDSVDNSKAYVLGTRFIKSSQKVDKLKLANVSVDFKSANQVVQ